MAYQIIDSTAGIPDISVAMLAYNHEKYISVAIDSILMQQTDFTFKIVIAEDCSTDCTRDLILDYQKKFPDRFRLILQNENIGAAQNNIDLLNNLEGRYIAALEGDDYWVDPFKLQKQVSFLNENPSYEFSMGRVDLLFDKTGRIKRKKEKVDPAQKDTYLLKDYLKAPFSQTSSFVFRNSEKPWPDWVKEVHAGDQSLVVIKAGISGRIKFHNELFSVYRINWKSVSHTQKYNVLEKFLETLEIWEEYLNNDEYIKIFEMVKIKYKTFIRFYKSDNLLVKMACFLRIKMIDRRLKFL